VGIFLEGEDSHGDHGLGRLVEFRFKAPSGTTSSSVTTHTSSGQRNCTSWASQPQKSVTLLLCPGGRTTKSTKDMWWHWKKKKHFAWNRLKERENLFDFATDELWKSTRYRLWRSGKDWGWIFVSTVTKFHFFLRWVNLLAKCIIAKVCTAGLVAAFGRFCNPRKYNRQRNVN